MTTTRAESVPSTPQPRESSFEHFATKHPWNWAMLVVLIAIGTSLFSRFPAYTDITARFPGNFAEISKTVHGRAIQWWLEHPFQRVPVESFFTPESLRDPLVAGAASHCDKLTYRAFLPLLNQVTGAGIWTLIGANHLAAIFTFLLGYRICFRPTRDPLFAALVVWAFAATWAGGWGFNDLMFGDTVAIGLLLATAILRQGWLVALVFVAAGLTDERAFVAAPLVALYRYWKECPPFSATAVRFQLNTAWAAFGPFLIGGLCYAACRLLATVSLNLHSGTSMMGTSEIVLYHFYVSYPGKIFKVFEFLWGFPFLVLFHLLTSGPTQRRDGLVFLACLVSATVPAILVWDVDRSLCYLLPAILVSACFLPNDPQRNRKRALLACVACFCWVEPNVSALRYFVFS